MMCLAATKSFITDRVLAYFVDVIKNNIIN